MESQSRQPVKVIAVTSGKGGVGKTQIAVNLAVALALDGHSTMLLDADLGLANAHLALGLKPPANLAHVVSGDCSLDEILLAGPAGITVVPAAPGESRLADLGLHEQMGLISAFSSLSIRPDYMVVDSGPGIGSTVLGFCAAADIALVVICDEPGSIADSCALLQSLSRERGVNRFHVVCNRVRNQSHGRRIFREFLAACEEPCDFGIQHVANIPSDTCFAQAEESAKALLECHPSCPAATALRALAQSAQAWETLGMYSGRPVFFAGSEVDAMGGLPLPEAN